ncbi:MAG: heme ABC transporter ATP-binding protein [Proteobacteria bacterium]|nr:MAG: heme ABC transporter ATP-binding protein [Pseudomonadota bacterium]
MQLSMAIQLTDVSKRFGAVRANDKVSLEVEVGTIHGIVGENGAGKSTLMSILYGFYQYDSGRIEVFGEQHYFHNSREALAAGIGMVHQHFMLVDPFTVLENVMLGNEGGRLLKAGRESARGELNRLASEYGLAVDLDARVSSLSVGLRQRVEILKALYRGAKILILDEPTGVLTPQETTELFCILNALKDQGVTILLITHKLQEIMAITDNVSVMRAGKMVAHRKTSETSKAEIAELMVGRKVLLQVDKQPANLGKPLISVKNLTVTDEFGVERVKGVSFDIHAGEVVGIAGVSGNGQSELLDALSGITRIHSGSIDIHGEVVTRKHPVDPAKMRDLGLAHVPEDRHRMGMINSFAAYESAVLGYHNDKAYNGRFLMSLRKVKEHCSKLMDAFDVRPRDPDLKSANFSGGNQQKLILAREMERDPDILLVGQPTRGVDIGAIEFIHKRIIEMRDAGKAVLLVSVELEEIISVSDRVLVMCDGHISGEVPAAEADETMLGLMMTNTDAVADLEKVAV